MGRIYSVACKDCKVVRDLDKLRTLESAKTAEEALKFSERLKKRPQLFREGLLLTFMHEHMGHDCVLFHDGVACRERLDPTFDNDFTEDLDFWNSDS